MLVGENNRVEEKSTVSHVEREIIEQLVLENSTINALIKGLLVDIDIFKKANEGKGGAPDVVRFTMQLNILKSKKERNLAAINEIIKNNKKNIR